MKYTILTLILTLIVEITLGQIAIFKNTQYDTDGQIIKTKIDTFYTSKIIDLDFYKKNYFIPYYYPKNFIDRSYKDTTITIWNNEDKEKDFKTNWSFNLTYDSLSRVVTYEYSGCLVCSQLPYELSIDYDADSKPIRLEKKYKQKNELINCEKESFESNEPFEIIEFTYDIQGNINLLRKEVFGKIKEKIEKI